MSRVQGWGLLAGLALVLAVLVLPAPPGLPLAGWRVLGLGLAMAVWWSTEPVPIALTSILPVLVLPLLGVTSLAEATAPFGNPLVFLFLGGFMLAAAVEQHGLHRRLAWHVLRRAGGDPRRLVAGFLLVTAFLSMWISNTAAVMLMLPVALAVTRDPAQPAALAVPVLLALAWGASIGGSGTLIGTPPNALMAAWLSESQGIELGFARWSALALPFVALFLLLAWGALTWRLPRGSGVALALQAPGPASRAEKRVAALFLAAAGLWMARPLLGQIPGLEALSDTGIALAVALALFVVPGGSGPLMRWEAARGIPWHVLLLFGGGLSLAAAMDGSGLAQWVGQGLAGLGDWPVPLILLAVSAAVMLLSELLSNTALVAALLPVIGAIAQGTGLPVPELAAAVALSASCAFMLPAGTPPNALVFASGQVSVAQMMRRGAVMNVVTMLLVTLVVGLWGPRVLG